MVIEWLKKKFREWSREAWEYGRADKIVASVETQMDSHSLRSEPVLTFTIFNAVGGKIVEFRYHDRTKDRIHTQMYIISKDDDFGEKIAKIATLETLKQ